MASRPEELIVMFEELADRLNIKLVQDKGDFFGGSCLVREENFIVVNKRKPLEQRLKVLAREFGKINLADVYLVPALRLYIESSQSK
jgi:Zn-dependent peptidase ImmA (M78 family)